MLLATMFVTLPFIVRELIPTLEQMDLAQEEAAKTLGANPLQVRMVDRLAGGLAGESLTKPLYYSGLYSDFPFVLTGTTRGS
jgi:ABC-type tungstate transport system substrate-binding protein